MRNSKKLYRSRKDKVIGGVAGGLAEYFEVDVVIFRLLFVLVFFLGGGGLIAYIIMLIVIPMEPYYTPYAEAAPGPQPGQPGPQSGPEKGQQADPPKSEPAQGTSEPHVESGKNNTGLVAGIILIVLGMVILTTHLVPWFRFHNFWPILLIVGGIFIIEPNLLHSKK